MLNLTIDVDWSPDLIVDEVVSILEKYEIPATLYCTDFTKDHSRQSSSLTGRFSEKIELGLHPNFIGVSHYELVFEQLKKIYPMAEGFRSHNGMTGYPIQQAALKFGLSYEIHCPTADIYIPPYYFNKHENNYFILSTNFFDSKALHNTEFDWSVNSLWFKELAHNQNVTIVVGFHPNILYYDMTTFDDYKKSKATYHQVDPKRSFKHKKHLNGAMKLFLELIEAYPKEVFHSTKESIQILQKNTQKEYEPIKWV